MPDMDAIIEYVKSMSSEQLARELDRLKTRRAAAAEEAGKAWSQLTKPQKGWLVEYWAAGFEASDLREAIHDTFTYAISIDRDNPEDDIGDVTYSLAELINWWNTLDQEDRDGIIDCDGWRELPPDQPTTGS